MRSYRERSWLFLGPPSSGLGWPGPGPGRRWLRSIVRKSHTEPRGRTEHPQASHLFSQWECWMGPGCSEAKGQVLALNVGSFRPPTSAQGGPDLPADSFCVPWNAERLVSGDPSTSEVPSARQLHGVSVPCSHRDPHI